MGDHSAGFLVLSVLCVWGDWRRTVMLGGRGWGFPC